MVRQRATSLSAVQLVQGFCFCSLPYTSVTCSLTHALSQSLAHAQQFFSASTPGQILAPRVCTLVLFINTCTCTNTYMYVTCSAWDIGLTGIPVRTAPLYVRATQSFTNSTFFHANCVCVLFLHAYRDGWKCQQIM